jgi:hypothetical protein
MPIERSVTPRVVAGIPIKPHVEKLMKLYSGMPRDGRVIRHIEISRAISEDYGTHRYRSICTSFKRRMLFEEGTLLVAVIGVGYSVEVADGAVKHGIGETVKASKRIRRASFAIAVQRDSELSEIGRQRREHAHRLVGRLLSAHDEIHVDLARLIAKPKSLPKPPEAT